MPLKTDLSLPELQNLTNPLVGIHNIVERFLKQQQTAQTEDWKKWHLMPKDTDITVLETLK